MQPVRPQVRRPLKPDLPWSGAPAQPYQRSAWTAAASARGEMAEPKLPISIEISPSRKDQRKRQLEQGIGVLLDTMPHSAHRVELVDVVDLAVAGMSIPKIARKLGISTSTVNKRLAEVVKAVKTEPRD
jgi:DNA-binding NarL/FixJ family response regulator